MPKGDSPASRAALERNRNLRGAPRKDTEKVTASFDRADLEALDRKAAALSVTRQDAVRLAVRAWAGEG